MNKVDPNSVYFQYDLLIPLLIALWDKIGFEIYNFYIFLNLILFIYLLGLYKLLSFLIRNKYILILSAFTIVFLRFYLIDMKFGTVFIQNSPLRADLWLPLVLVAIICGIKSKRLFATLIIVLIFSFNMGVLYFIAYYLTLLMLSLFEMKMNTLKALTLWIKQNLIKLLIFIAAFSLLYAYVYSFGENIGTKQFLKYSIQSNKIQKFSIIWIALLFIGILSSYIANRISGIKKEKLSIYVFLIFLTIVNFTFCFYKNTILSFISVSTSFFILFFIYIDLKSNFFKSLSENFLKFRIIKIIPIIFLLFPLSFNKYGVPTIINNQYRFLSSNSAFKARKINIDIKQIDSLKQITNVFINENPIMISLKNFDEKIVKSYREKCLQNLKTFRNKQGKTVVNILKSSWDKWDMYSVNVMFFQMMMGYSSKNQKLKNNKEWTEFMKTLANKLVY